VLRGGRVSGECDPREQTNASLSQMMIGSEPPALVHSQRQHGELVLDVRQLNLPRLDPFGTHLSAVDLQVHQGEIVGIAGVSGNGQRELLYALSGEDVRAAPDSIRLAGQPVGQRDPAQRRALGLHFVPDERLGRGAVPGLSLAHNLLLTRHEAISRSGWVNMSALAAQASAIIATYQVKAGGPQAAAQSLSGGNLQKFIVGREIDAAPRLLIVSQPTWGVDVGAAAQIRSALMALRDAGCAVLVVSEELDELFELCDRMHVMAQGRMSPSLSRAQATVAKIGSWMSGLWTDETEKVH
jgi:simple sugar transport system ATP-binding protein